MKTLLPLLFAALICSACCSRPEVTTLGNSRTQLSNQCYDIIFNSEAGGHIETITWDGELIGGPLLDFYPSAGENFRLSRGLQLNDGESIICATYHKKPRLTMNRSFVILDNQAGLKISWTGKNTGKETISGHRLFRLPLAGEVLDHRIDSNQLTLKIKAASGKTITLALQIMSDDNNTFDISLDRHKNQTVIEFRDAAEISRTPRQRTHWWLILRAAE